MALQPHQQRVVDEKDALDTKIDALDEFIRGSFVFDTLDDAEQDRLKRQYLCMKLYTQVLGERIKAF